METYTVEVQSVTFIVEAEDKDSAVGNVHDILTETAFGWDEPQVL